jgi:hypothetical protein
MPTNNERLPRRYASYRAAITSQTPLADWERELLATTEREEGEVPTTRNCHRCGNREDPGFAWIEWHHINGQDYCHGCVQHCSECNEVGVVGSFNGRGGYCNNCDMDCWNCGDTVHADLSDGLIWNDRPYCNDCMTHCAGCENQMPTDTMIHCNDVNDRRCSNCATYCGECDGYNAGPCTCASNDYVRGYGATEARLWLGGPLPHNEATSEDNGYYIGFELEIAADNSDSGRRRGANVTGIKDWAEEHLGDRDALDCKHDGSVRGFEIASQPMTPEFFENVDWESFMDVLNRDFPLSALGWSDEPREHGLHVHIGRVAFRRDDVAQAAYSYLLSQGEHLERIGRRAPYNYCRKVIKPVSASVVSTKPYGRQGQRLRNNGVSSGRDAVNLTNNRTIEIRAFKSTRSANQLRDAVRVTYLAAEYIRELRGGGWKSTAQALHWSEFAKWVRDHYPQAHASIAGDDVNVSAESNAFPECPKFWV